MTTGPFFIAGSSVAPARHPLKPPEVAVEIVKLLFDGGAVVDHGFEASFDASDPTSHQVNAPRERPGAPFYAAFPLCPFCIVTHS